MDEQSGPTNLSAYACGVVFTTVIRQSKWKGIIPDAFVHTGDFAHILELIVERQRCLSNADGIRKSLIPFFIIFDNVDVPVIDREYDANDLKINLVHASSDDYAGQVLLDKAAWDLSKSYCGWGDS